jgi:hypothetical protein
MLKMKLNCILDSGKEFSFPFSLCIPKNGNVKHKTIVSINFHGETPNKYYPMEEIADRGWAVANFYYQDVTSDSANVDGLLALLDDKDVGKITLWAWGAMRILDYLYTRDDIDLENIAVAGHSRLGKTALLCAAYDTRFRFCHSNCSGTCGAALFSEIEGGAQSIENIVTDLPYWFNDRFTVYKGMEQEMPFDQDMLISLIAPRYVSISSAEKDAWANPKGERMCGVKASYVWEALGERGLVIPDDIEVDMRYFNGNIGYYMRSGRHFFSRKDWNSMIDFFELKSKV